MIEPVYVSKVRVLRVKDSLRRAELPGRREPIWFGVHGGIAEHYGISQEEREATTATLDYLVASAVG